MNRRLAMSAMWRALAVTATVMIVFACLADVAHAAGGEAGDCPQGKLETQRPSAPSLDAAVLPDRVQPVEPTMLVGLVHAETLPTARSALVRRSSPRAPPIA